MDGILWSDGHADVCRKTACSCFSSYILAIYTMWLHILIDVQNIIYCYATNFFKVLEKLNLISAANKLFFGQSLILNMIPLTEVREYRAVLKYPLDLHWHCPHVIFYWPQMTVIT
jgi:hypothetical protein